MKEVGALLAIALMTALFGPTSPDPRRQSAGVDGSLVVTATILSSAAIVVDPDGVPHRAIANTSDSPETFVRLVSDQQNVKRIPREKTSLMRTKGTTK